MTAYPYAYDDWDDGRQRRSSGAGAFAILGFLALGVLALGAGAVLAGVFSSDPGVGGIDPTLTPSPVDPGERAAERIRERGAHQRREHVTQHLSSGER